MNYGRELLVDVFLYSKSGDWSTSDMKSYAIYDKKN